MVAAACRTLADLAHHGGCMVAECECGRAAIFSIFRLVMLFNDKGWDTSYKAIRARLICDPQGGGCGKRPSRFYYHQDESPKIPDGVLCLRLRVPRGVDAVAFAMADDRGKARLIRHARD